MKEAHECYAIITGASSGLGKALSEELGRRGHSLLLVDLPDTGLAGHSSALSRKYNITVRYFEADLTNPETPGEIKKFVSAHNLAVGILINNVGIGYGGEIGSYTDAAVRESIMLNVGCTTLLANAFIEELKKREKAWILNIGSFGGFLPMPYKSIYSATKSYIYYFSLAIRNELRGTNVSVSVAMPGPILTNDRVRQRVRKQGFISKSNVIDARKAASYIIERMFRGRSVIIPRWTIRIWYGIASCTPYRILMAVLGKLFKGIN